MRTKNNTVPDFLLRHSIENREETRQQVYMEGRIYGERENAWGGGGGRNPQNYFEQENEYLKMSANNNRLNNGRMNLNGPEENGWGPSNQQSNGRPIQKQNNYNRNGGMASTVNWSIIYI